MMKALRNTVFTVVALGLTTLGLYWNKEVARQHDPVAIGRSVLASQSLGIDEQVFPLSISFSRPAMKLGQVQEMTIKTVPFAELDIVTTYPDGTIDNPQTTHAKADANGSYTMKYKLSDFSYLGVIKTAVVATSNTKTSEAAQVFALQPWSADTSDQGDDRYVHPLVP